MSKEELNSLKIGVAFNFFNEIDVLPRFIENLKKCGIENIIAVDGRFIDYPSTSALSDDGSREFLEKEGIKVIDFGICTHHEKVNFRFKEASKYMDFVVFLAPDEVLYGDCTKDNYEPGNECVCGKGLKEHWNEFCRNLKKAKISTDDDYYYGSAKAHFPSGQYKEREVEVFIFYKPQQFMVRFTHWWWYKNGKPLDSHHPFLIEGITKHHDHTIRKDERELAMSQYQKTNYEHEIANARYMRTYEIPFKKSFDNLGKINPIEKFPGNRIISYVEDRKYIGDISEKISGVFCKPEFASEIRNKKPWVEIVKTNIPKFDWILLHNYLVAIDFYKKPEPIIRSIDIDDGFETAERDSGEKIRALHDGGVKIGNNTKFQKNVSVKKGIFNQDTEIGDNCDVGSGTSIGHNCKIGNNNIICPNVTIAGYCEIGDRNFIGIGSNIKHNITIGNNCTIGAGSVITKDVPNNTVIKGNPGKVLKK